MNTDDEATPTTPTTAPVAVRTRNGAVLPELDSALVPSVDGDGCNVAHSGTVDRVAPLETEKS